jgi:hypothetical protein
MATSMRAAVAGLAALAFALAACDALLGLGKYKDVSCAGDCGSDAEAESSGAFEPDAADAADAAAVYDAALEADAVSAPDVVVDVVPTPESGWPTPTAHEIWAHWPMPNPDASIGGDSSTPLPNPMSYDAGPEGGSPVAFDEVTNLAWYRQSASATTYDAAWGACSGLGSTWRVPTRIELISLVDFTQIPTINPAVFPSVQGDSYWTSSSVPDDSGPAVYWSVSFATGLAAYGPTPTEVLCVSGGTP